MLKDGASGVKRESALPRSIADRSILFNTKESLKVSGKNCHHHLIVTNRPVHRIAPSIRTFTRGCRPEFELRLSW